MHFVSTRIQKGYLRRIGIRGRWLTAYIHRYGGRQESSERFHQHPWRVGDLNCPVGMVLG